MKKILHLNLKKEWFDMILSGEKKEEYREIKRYWTRRLTHHNVFLLSFLTERIQKYNMHCKYFDEICFSNGYRKNRRQMFIKYEGIRIGYGRKEWGAEGGVLYYIIGLGKIL